MLCVYWDADMTVFNYGNPKPIKHVVCDATMILVPGIFLELFWCRTGIYWNFSGTTLVSIG